MKNNDVQGWRMSKYWTMMGNGEVMNNVRHLWVVTNNVEVMDYDGE